MVILFLLSSCLIALPQTPILGFLFPVEHSQGAELEEGKGGRLPPL